MTSMAQGMEEKNWEYFNIKYHYYTIKYTIRFDENVYFKIGKNYFLKK